VVTISSIGIEPAISTLLSRLLAALLLQRSGYGFRKLLSLDTHYQRYRNDYIEALRRSLGQAYNTEYESTEWLSFFTKSLLVQAGLLEQRLTDWRIGVEEIHRDWAGTGLNDRQIDDSTISITLDTYSHVAPGLQEAAAKRFDDALQVRHNEKVY